MKQKISKFKEWISNLIYPKGIKCVFCSGELNQNEYNNTCENCLDTLPFIKRACERCGAPLNENQTGVCLSCKSRNYSFVQAKSVFEYNAEPLIVVHNLKYNGKKYLVESMVKYLVDVYAKWNVFADFVTCVPMFETKEKLRGYNQSKLLTQKFSEITNVPFVEFCVKVVDTTSQTELSVQERLENVKDSFTFKREFKKNIKNKTILIIDDVVTTGATTDEISKVLLKAGAKECFVLSFARTKLKQMDYEQKEG